jgi:hypothetical protein
MTAWAKDQGTMGTMIQLLGDPRREFTDSLGLVLDDEKAMSVLGNPRCKRFSMFVDDGVVKSLTVAEGDVPAEDTFVEKMVGNVKGASAFGGGPPALAGTRSAAMKSASLGAGWQPGLNPGQVQPSISQPLGGYKVAPRLVPNVARPGANMRFGGVRLSEETSPNDPSTLAVLLISFVVGASVTFAMFRFRRSASKEPLLVA